MKLDEYLNWKRQQELKEKSYNLSAVLDSIETPLSGKLEDPPAEKTPKEEGSCVGCACKEKLLRRVEEERNFPKSLAHKKMFTRLIEEVLG